MQIFLFNLNDTPLLLSLLFLGHGVIPIPYRAVGLRRDMLHFRLCDHALGMISTYRFKKGMGCWKLYEI
jgi:hypothetical protein